MKKIYICVAAAVLACAGLYAQSGLNSTVNITNDYQSRSIALSRYELPFGYPDSLARFDYNFDYSVFDKPYQGAFEFNPYSVKMVPGSTFPQDRTLYVRAGAGYCPHPELQAVWSAVKSDRFTLSVFQDFHGYAGQYRELVDDVTATHPLWTYAGRRWNGYDLSEKFGVAARLEMKKTVAGLDLGYKGIFTKDNSMAIGYNALGFRLSFRTPEVSQARVLHDVALSAEWGMDAIPHVYEGKVYFGEADYALTGFIGGRAFGVGKFVFGADFDLRFSDRNSRQFSKSGYVRAVPKFIFENGRIRFDAGVGLHGVSKFLLSPEVNFEMNLLKRSLVLFAGTTGGLQYHTYSKFKEENHWFYAGYMDALKDSEERLRAFVGVKGVVAARLQYKVSAGWSATDNAAFWGIKLNGLKMIPALVYSDCRTVFAEASAKWSSEHIDAEGSFLWNNVYGTSETGAVLPAALSGNASASYKWRGRIRAGVDVEASSARKVLLKGYDIQVQPYCDLGVHAEFVFSDRLSFWLRGRNLLCESIQKFPLHVENSPEITVGAVFNL